MPKVKSIHVGIKVTPAQKAKLDKIAETTGRTISLLIRKMIDEVEMTGNPDIRMDLHEKR